MLNQWIRVYYGDNGVLTDYSLANATSATIPIVMVATEDYIYIGQRFVFNNMFIKIGTANTTTSTMSLEYWGNMAWNAVSNLIDGTSSGGKTFAQSGQVYFTPDEDKPWDRVYDTSIVNASTPTALNTIKLYDLYWLRIKVSANLSAGSTIDGINYCFADDAGLLRIDPDINDYLTGWATGKTSWLDQMLDATQQVIIDFKTRNFLKGAGELIAIDELYYPTLYKCLILIYKGLGGDKFQQKIADREKDYIKIMAGIKPSVDTNSNARQDISEIGNKIGVITR